MPRRSGWCQTNHLANGEEQKCDIPWTHFQDLDD